MDKFIEAFKALVTQSVSQIHDFVIRYGPTIAFALAIIIIGWIAAIIVKKIVAKLLRALGFDVIAEKTGLKRLLDRGEIRKRPSALVGLVFYWVIFLNALIMASEAVDVKIMYEFVRHVIFYVPKFAVSVIFFVLGFFISRFVYKVVEKTSRAANVPLYRMLGNIARYGTLGIAIMVILRYMGVGAATITQFFVVIFIVVPLASFVAFLVGGKDIISCMLAKKYLIREYKTGDIITFDDITGRIEAIDFVSTKLSGTNETIIIPNSLLAGKIIKKKT